MIALLAEADFRRVWLVGAIAGGLRWLELLAIGVYVLAAHRLAVAWWRSSRRFAWRRCSFAAP